MWYAYERGMLYQTSPLQGENQGKGSNVATVPQKPKPDVSEWLLTPGQEGGDEEVMPKIKRNSQFLLKTMETPNLSEFGAPCPEADQGDGARGDLGRDLSSKRYLPEDVKDKMLKEPGRNPKATGSLSPLSKRWLASSMSMGRCAMSQ